MSKPEEEKKENKGVMSNFKNMIKIGSDKIKEKFSNLFSKNKEESKKTEIKKSGSTKKEEEINNDAFKIEEDIDNNDLSFHVDNEDEVEEEKVENPKSEEERKKSGKVSILPKQVENKIKEIESLDSSSFVHRVYLKGTLLDIEGYPIVRCLKNKKQNKILSFMGIGKNKVERFNYIMLFDENFLYFIKDENNIPDKSNPNIKKMSKNFNLRMLSNVIFKTVEDEKKSIVVSFAKEEFSPIDSEKIERELVFNKGDEQIFMAYLNLFLSKINKPTITLN